MVARALRSRDGIRVVVLSCVALATAVAAFVAANPYSVLARSEFMAQFSWQTTIQTPKIGFTETNGFRYYGWVLTWGLGLVSCVGAIAGVWSTARRHRLAFFLLAPPPILFFVFMASKSRFFSRWLLPAFPFLVLLAAFIRRARSRRALVAVALLGAAIAPNLVRVVHTDIVLSRKDTRSTAREWMIEHIPRHSAIALDPMVRPGWTVVDGEARWKRPVILRYSAARYITQLEPSLIERYQRARTCWVIASSMFWSRAYASPAQFPEAVAYYRRLEREGTVAFRVSPHRPGGERTTQSYDWNQNYFPFTYTRPGPEIRIYRLHGGKCARA